MKTLLKVIFIISYALSLSVYADYYVNGYFKKDGTYVDGHWKTSKNSTNWDNYSTKGNANPYNDKIGSRAKDYSFESYNYGKGKIVTEGSSCGQSYINSKGNKVYFPKR